METREHRVVKDKVQAFEEWRRTGPNVFTRLHQQANLKPWRYSDTALVWTLPTPGPGGEMGTLILQGIFTPSF